jgi:hypothetical protein
VDFPANFPILLYAFDYNPKDSEKLKIHSAEEALRQPRGGKSTACVMYAYLHYLICDVDTLLRMHNTSITVLLDLLCIYWVTTQSRLGISLPVIHVGLYQSSLSSTSHFISIVHSAPPQFEG